MKPTTEGITDTNTHPLEAPPVLRRPTAPAKTRPETRRPRWQVFEIRNVPDIRVPEAPADPDPQQPPLVDAAVSEAFAREVAAAGLSIEKPHTLLWAASRLADILIASAALVVSAPVIALMIVAVRLDSPGPAVFRQRRVGKGLKPFTLLKMRTLYVDAKERFPELYSYEFTRSEIKTLNLSDLKAPDDPRVTRLGKWLRKSSLDELPNFWNLLKGDIALVGPRPELFECLKYYEGPQLLKFAVRPGLTGLAQVSGRNSNSFQQMIRLDLDYVRNRSLVMDVRISLLTVKAVLSRHGAW